MGTAGGISLAIPHEAIARGVNLLKGSTNEHEHLNDVIARECRLLDVGETGYQLYGVLLSKAGQNEQV